MTKLTIWFWQRMITPHMAYLAVALARRGHDVTYVTEEELADERIALGWQSPDLRDVTLEFATNAKEAKALVETAPRETVHLTQGLRSNGYVADAQNAIRDRGQRHFVIMETVDLRGISGLIKPALYSWHLYQWRQNLDGILGIGAETPAWLRRRGPKGLRAFPFAYFLPEHSLPPPVSGGSRFRFLFVGSLIPLKRLGLLLQTLGALSNQEFDVEVVGDGPMRAELEALAERILPGRVSFRGVLAISKIPEHMVQADCLVLPSSHDGWGAVVSEALMAGTQVICSAACGSHAIVQISGTGGVFDTSDTVALQNLLKTTLARGKITSDDRKALQTWARCLGVDAGAGYLEALITDTSKAAHAPRPPWEEEIS